MVNAPPMAAVVQVASVYQLTVPVELELAVNAWPPADVTALPNASWSWTVMTRVAPPQAPAVKVRLGVVIPSRFAAAALMLNAALVARVRPGDVATRV